MRVFAPGAGFIFGFDGGGVVGVEGIAGGIGEGDGVFELCESGVSGGCEVEGKEGVPQVLRAAAMMGELVGNVFQLSALPCVGKLCST